MFEEFGRVFSGCRSFHHNVSQLTAATILVQTGNRVGLAAAVGSGVRTPDMYVNFAENGRLHIEVKAPEALQWASTVKLDDLRIAKILKHQLEHSQINSQNPGILVIGCTRFASIGRIKKIFTDTLKKFGNYHKSVAGIYLIQSKDLMIKNKNESGILSDQAVTENSLILNSHYIGENSFHKQPRYKSK